MDGKLVRHVDLEPTFQVCIHILEVLGRTVRTGAGGNDLGMAGLVQGEVAGLALVPLLAQPPQELLAQPTEGGLPEEPRVELVIVHHVHLGLFDRT